MTRIEAPLIDQALDIRLLLEFADRTVLPPTDHHTHCTILPHVHTSNHHNLQVAVPLCILLLHLLVPEQTMEISE